MTRIAGRAAAVSIGAASLAAAAALYVHLAGVPRYPTTPVEFAVDITPERVARGRRTALMLCVSCHKDPDTGALTGRPLADLPPLFGEVHSTNITRDARHGIGSWSDGELAYLLRTGVARDGRYTPPWMLKLPLIADEELRDLIAFLRSDDPLVRPAAVPSRPTVPSFASKVLARFVFKPLPYPSGPLVAPPPSDRVGYGRYLATARLRCHECHSQALSTVNATEPEKSEGYFGGGYAMKDREGRTVYSTNLTPHPTGLGGWTEDQFRKAMKVGIRPDGRPLRRPMIARPELTDDEVAALWAYLRSLPPLANAVPAG
jgi:hypothetical protein